MNTYLLYHQASHSVKAKLVRLVGAFKRAQINYLKDAIEDSAVLNDLLLHA